MPLVPGLGSIARLLPCAPALLLPALLGSATAAGAADVAVVMSADVDAYTEALKGFKASLRHKVVAEYDMEGDLDRGRKQVAEIGAKVKPDLILAVGIWALQALSKEASTVPVVYAMVLNPPSVIFFCTETATGAIMTLPLHDALPI